MTWQRDTAEIAVGYRRLAKQFSGTAVPDDLLQFFLKHADQLEQATSAKEVDTIIRSVAPTLDKLISVLTIMNGEKKP